MDSLCKCLLEPPILVWPAQPRISAHRDGQAQWCRAWLCTNLNEHWGTYHRLHGKIGTLLEARSRPRLTIFACIDSSFTKERLAGLPHARREGPRFLEMKLRQERVPLFSCRCFFNPIRSPAEPMTIKRGILKSAVWRLRRDLAEGNLNRIRLRQRATTSPPSAPDPWRASPHCASSRTAAVAHLAVAVDRDRAVRLNPAHGSQRC
jgi:hypothetical protein